MTLTQHSALHLRLFSSAGVLPGHRVLFACTDGRFQNLKRSQSGVYPGTGAAMAAGIRAPAMGKSTVVIGRASRVGGLTN